MQKKTFAFYMQTRRKSKKRKGVSAHLLGRGDVLKIKNKKKSNDVYVDCHVHAAAALKLSCTLLGGPSTKLSSCLNFS